MSAAPGRPKQARAPSGGSEAYAVASVGAPVSAAQGRPIRRRPLLGTGALVLLLGPARLAWGARVVAVRLWPAEDYTRLTIESDGLLTVGRTSMKSPRQMAVDIAGVDLYDGVRELVNKLRADDPNVAAIRVDPARQGEVTLTIDLKQPVEPQIFHLAPVAAYRHRLVIDLYPREAPDPLDQLIRERMAELDEASARAARLLGLEVESVQRQALRNRPPRRRRRPPRARTRRAGRPPPPRRRRPNA